MSQTLSVQLPETTVVVSGTVNGVETTWVNVSANVWQTTAARSADDVYRLELTLISITGVTSTQTITLYYGLLNLITDRTEADRERALYLDTLKWEDMTEAEREEWQGTMKGAYNASDMNRVGAAVEYVAERLASCGIAVSVAPVTGWAEGDLPTVAQLMAYLDDVRAIRAALPVPSSTPKVPEDMDALTVDEANNIEKILLRVDALITQMLLAWYYTGEIQTGEV